MLSAHASTSTLPGPDSWATQMHVADLYSQEWTKLARKAPPFFKPVELGRDEGQLLFYDQPDAVLPRAVLLRDSFGTALAPMLAPYFSRLACLWQWYMDKRRVPEVIVAEHPDVVLDVVVERLLIQTGPLFFTQP